MATVRAIRFSGRYSTCKRGLRVQSFLFARSVWQAADAGGWLSKHKKRHGKVDTKANYLRFRQFEPSTCVRGSFRTIAIGRKRRGIKAVVCCPRKGR